MLQNGTGGKDIKMAYKIVLSGLQIKI